MKLMRVFATVLMCSAIVRVEQSAQAAPTLNGWDTDNIYVIRTNVYSYGEPEVPGNSIQIITETNLIPDKPLARFGTFLVYNDFDVKTFTFSNSPFAGANSPAGARMFLVEAAPGNSRKVDIELYEFASTGAVLRKSSLGSTFGAGTGQLVLASQSNNQVSIGSIRYNPKRNTLGVSATLATNNGGTVTAKAFEFALPDWPANGGSGFVAVTPVQTYDGPAGHNIFSSDPTNIDFDDDGNMYMTGRSFNANSSGNNTKGDVIKVSTIGRNGGTTPFVIPITGGNASNLLIEGAVENQTPNYSNLQSLAVRTSNHSILVLPRTADGAADPTLEYDLNTRAGNGNLTLVQDWGTHFSGFGVNSNVNTGQRDPDSGGVFVSADRGEPGGGPKRINPAGGIEVIGYRSFDVTSPPQIPLVPYSADADNDGDVDQSDFAKFQNCMTTSLTVAMFSCQIFDVNHDNAINVTDFNAFLPCVSGPDHPKPGGC